MLAPPTLPPGMKFEPADCAKFATEQVIPAGLKGNMAATSAEGEGNRFIAIAVETSEPVPLDDPGQNCQKVGFAGGGCAGSSRSSSRHRSTVFGRWAPTACCRPRSTAKPRTGELYNYVAGFDTFLVIVTANLGAARQAGRSGRHAARP